MKHMCYVIHLKLANDSQVSSSYVQSFGSYHVDKQTDKQTPLKTSTSLRCATPLSCYAFE